MQLPSVCGWLTGKKGRDYPALRAWSRPCEAKRPAPSCGGLGSGWKICYCSRLCADAVHSFFVGSRMGPRACVFDQRGERCYVLCEISSAVMTFSYMDGRLEFLQAVPSVAEPGGVPSSGADLHLAPDGRFLYASNRGQDSITVFSVQADGTLQLVQAVGCGGRTPRNFALDPTGGWVLVGAGRPGV